MSEIDRTLTRAVRLQLESTASSSAKGNIAVETVQARRTSPYGGFETSARPSSTSSVIDRIWPYVQIARVDHWFKNAFMLLGVVLAFFYQPELLTWSSGRALILALIATCLIASSNYVLNEQLDGPGDRLHPKKRFRPVPSGKIRPALAYLEWLLLGAAGMSIAVLVNPPFAFSALGLWILGVTYNVPPVRTKEWPYIDVLSESANNAVRLLLGWFPLIADRVPPVSLVVSYWMVGAFFMATKRYAEYRHIGNKEVAASYRRSFAFYTEERLLVSILFYATTCALFAGIFMVRYHLELILYAPVAAGMFAYYLHIGMLPDSPVQNPEKLYRQKGFFAYMCCCAVLFILLMFTSMPVLYDLFNVEPTRTDPLWTIGWSLGSGR
jgi:decaprenyl-phosphate phosphoribosyltransferase